MRHAFYKSFVGDVYGRVSEVLQDRDGSGGYTAGDLLTRHTYDPRYGRLTRVTTDQDGDAMTPDRVLNYAYDNATGRQLSTWTGNTSDSASTSASTRTDHTYDRLGRLTTTDSVKLAGGAGAGTTTYRYDPVGNLQYVLGPAHASYYQYDGLNRLNELTQFKDDGNGQYDGNEPLIATFSYTLADDGQREGLTEVFFDANGLSEYTTRYRWTYDNADRLIEERIDADGAASDRIASYEFDLVGNRVVKRTDTNPSFGSVTDLDSLRTVVAAYDTRTESSYDANDRLLNEQVFDAGMTGGSVTEETVYEYGTNDEATQLTKKTVYDGAVAGGIVDSITRQEYDLQGRLEATRIDSDLGSAGDETVSTYQYDHDGIRVSQTVNGSETHYLVDKRNPTGYAQVLEEIDAATDAVTRAYALGHDVLVQFDANDGITFLLYDGHGSTRALLDDQGQVVTIGGEAQRFLYDAYGQMLADSTAFASQDDASTTLLYSGEQTDHSTGNQYLRARYYNPANGRFNRLDDFAGNSQDPQSLHKYLYTHGNPTNGIDPSGLFSIAGLGAANSIASSLASLQGEVGQIGIEAAQSVAEGNTVQQTTTNILVNVFGGVAVGAAFTLSGTATRVIADKVSGFIQDSGQALIRLVRSRQAAFFYSELDSLGRSTGARAVITARSIKRAAGSVPTVTVKGAGGDLARGHLIGRQLGGVGNDARNLAPTYQVNVNNSAMLIIENQVKRRALAGETIDYAVVPIYKNDELVPVGFTVSARGSNGFTLEETVRNVSELGRFPRKF